MQSLNTYESPRLAGYLYKRYYDIMIRAARFAISDAMSIPLGIANTIAAFCLFTLDEYDAEVWQTQILTSEPTQMSGLKRDRWSDKSFTIHICDTTNKTVRIELDIHNPIISELRCAGMQKITVPIGNHNAYSDINNLIDLFQWNFKKRQKSKKLFCYEYIGRLLIAAYMDKAGHLQKLLTFSCGP